MLTTLKQRLMGTNGREFLRGLVIADFHCGHVLGLTPSVYNPKVETSIQLELHGLRALTWDWFVKNVDLLRPIDFVLANGDLIEGKGERSGGTELITMDRLEQAAVARDVIKFIGAPAVYISYGTPYHTGSSEDLEDLVALMIGAGIKSHGQLTVYQTVFDYKHFIPSSSMPYGRHTALAKESVWNIIAAAREEALQADIIIRSHVHYFTHAEGADWDAFITPALQLSGTKYGLRGPSGPVDFGFLHFDIYPNGDFVWKKHLLVPKRAKVQHAETLP